MIGDSYVWKSAIAIWFTGIPITFFYLNKWHINSGLTEHDSSLSKKIFDIKEITPVSSDENSDITATLENSNSSSTLTISIKKIVPTNNQASIGIQFEVKSNQNISSQLKTWECQILGRVDEAINKESLKIPQIDQLKEVFGINVKNQTPFSTNHKTLMVKFLRNCAYWGNKYETPSSSNDQKLSRIVNLQSKIFQAKNDQKIISFQNLGSLIY